MADRDWPPEMQQALKRAVVLGEPQGAITIGQLNALLPEADLSPALIESIYSLLNEHGIDVVEDDTSSGPSS